MPFANRVASMRSVLLLATSALSAAPLAAFAATDIKDSVLEEVLVTSAKMGEMLIQDTPLAITALSANALEDMQYENIGNIAGLVPNLSISQNEASARVYIRGIGTNLDFVGSDPSVAVYLDGVYLARPTMVFSDFIDIERVEVLRGPQGTLYGRNAAGGVISVISKKPGNELEGRLTGEYGSYDRWRLAGSVSGPILAEKVSTSLAASRTKRDGHTNNFGAGPDDFNNEDSKSFRGSLLLTPAPSLEITLNADYAEENTRYAFAPLHVDILGNPLVSGAQIFTDPYDVITSIDDPFEYNENYGFSGSVNWQLSDQISLTSITAYRRSKHDLRIDTDFTELNILVSNVFEASRQFTQEFQIQGSTDHLNWVGGLYYLHERNLMDAYIELPGPGVAMGFGDTFANPFHIIGHTDAYAAFAQATYSVTDRLSLTAGIRYSYEEKDIDKTVWLEAGGLPLPFGGFTQQQKNDWKAWTPKFGIDYKIDDNKLLYATATRGFKSGGFNFSGFQDSFDPEYLWAFEAGLKSDWLDGRLRINTSAFYYDYKDLQVQGFYIPDDGGASGVLIANASSAKVKGVEVEMTAQPSKALTLTANLSYLDATYSDYITARSDTPNVPVDVTGNRLNNAPKWMFNAAAQYTTEIGNNGRISLRGEFRWQDDIFYTVFNDPAVGQDSYGLLNAMISWESADEHWKLTAYGRNLTNKLYFTSKPDWSPTGVGGSLPEPRVFGVIGSYRF